VTKKSMRNNLREERFILLSFGGFTSPGGAEWLISRQQENMDRRKKEGATVLVTPFLHPGPTSFFSSLPL
jgi:hypothetical protein